MNAQGFQIEPPVLATQPRKGKSGCFWASLSIGCLTVLLLTCGGFILLGFFGFTAALRSTEPYQQALKAAQNDPEVQQAVGENIEASWPMTGSINNTNGQESVDIEFTVKGSKGSGKVHVRGQRNNGPWQYDQIEFSDSSGNKIDLKKSDSNEH